MKIISENTSKKEDSIQEIAAPKKLFRTKKGKLGIEWSDSLRATYGIKDLRFACPCALCVDETTGEKLLTLESIPDSIQLLSLMSVGRYAMGLTFSDGHKSGIYSYTLLKSLTKCE